MTGGGLIPPNEGILGNPPARNVGLQLVGNGQGPPISGVNLGPPAVVPVSSEADNLPPGNNVITPPPGSGAGNIVAGQGHIGGNLPLGQVAPWAADLQAMSADVQASVRALQDQFNLKKVDPKADATGRRVRWSIELNLYDFEVIYKKGRRHSDADAMSRITDHDDYAKDEELAGLTEEERDIFFVMGQDDFDAITAVDIISQEENRKELAEEQDACDLIREVKRRIRANRPPPADYPHFFKFHFSKFAIQDNILHRKAIDPSTGLPILQAIIPPRLVSKVLKDAHGTQFAGHPGHQRMVDTLERHVTWPGIYPDCKEAV